MPAEFRTPANTTVYRSSSTFPSRECRALVPVSAPRISAQRRRPSPHLLLIGSLLLLSGAVLLLFLQVLSWGSESPKGHSARAWAPSPTVSTTHQRSQPSPVQQNIRLSPLPEKEKSHEGIAAPVLRIAQSDPSQYDAAGFYTAGNWWASACSVSSMAMVLRSYGVPVRVVDVLRTAYTMHAISQDAGLLNISFIGRIAQQYHFQASWLQDASIEAAVRRVNETHRPLIANIIGSPDWTPGHFLVITGGTSSQVMLADPSNANLRTVSYRYLSAYWQNRVVELVPLDWFNVQGPPTMSASQIDEVLQQAGSPAAGKGQTLYDLGRRYGIDPIYALAFFRHESTFGTRGEARKTMSLGNLRCIDGRPCVDRNPDGTGGYAQMKSWEDGFEIWYQLITGPFYKGAGLTTVDAIIPRYAPSTDNNDEGAYISSVEQAVVTWRNMTVRQ